MEKILEAKSTDTVMSLFGSFDSNVKLIEREMDVRITNKDTIIKIIGDNCEKAANVVSRLINEIELGETLTEQNIRYAIFSVNEDIDYVPPAKGDYICITAKGKSVKCKTYGQKNYIQKIRDNTVVIAIGQSPIHLFARLQRVLRLRNGAVSSLLRKLMRQLVRTFMPVEML